MGDSKPQSRYFTFSLRVLLLGPRGEGAAARWAGGRQSRAGPGEDQVLHIDGVCSPVRV